MLIAIQAPWNSDSDIHQAFVPNQENRNHIKNIRILKIGHLWLAIIIYVWKMLRNPAGGTEVAEESYCP